MSSRYPSFGADNDPENDDIDDALGSILSWDDDEDNTPSMSGASAAVNAALRERQTSRSSGNGRNTKEPPDLVQFSINQEGQPQFSFYNNSDPAALRPSQEAGNIAASSNQQGSNNGESLTMSLPMPTSVADMNAQDQEQKQKKVNLQQQQHQVQSQQNQQQQAQLAMNLARMLSQQQQQAMMQSQQSQQQAQRGQGKQPNPPVAMNNAMGMFQPGQANQASQQQQMQNVMIQQFQFAQLQQQMQQVQAQQRQSMNAPQKAAATPRNATTGQAAAKKTKTSDKNKSKKSLPVSAGMSHASAATGVVSASDTEGPYSKTLLDVQDDDVHSLPRVHTSIMSAAEKAQLNRDRNREHARNTRLRKKAYLEKLKTTVDELCRERDTLVSERAGAANLLVEMHNSRTEVLMSFFALRSTNEQRRNLWSTILDESCFTCTMPVTPYRYFPASEVQVTKCQRHVVGIDGMMADTASLHVLLDSLVDRARFPSGKIEFRYTLVTEDAIVSGNQMMARWTMQTVNARKVGVATEVAKYGMVSCKFNSNHEITHMEFMFDVMAFMLQLKQAAGAESFPVVPNTVQTCQRNFDKPMVMFLADPPYTIVQINTRWIEMTGFSSDDVVGKASCSVLNGRDTERARVEELMTQLQLQRPHSTSMISYRKSGETFRQFQIYLPLSIDSRITHYMCETYHVDTSLQQLPPMAPATAQSQPRLQAAVPSFSGNAVDGSQGGLDFQQAASQYATDFSGGNVFQPLNSMLPQMMPPPYSTGAPSTFGNGTNVEDDGRKPAATS